MKTFFTAAGLLAMSLGLSAQTVIHVATTGDDSAAGTAEAPFATVQKAIETVEPGGTIYVHAGTYYLTERIKVPAKNTDADNRIRLWAYGDGEAILDGSQMSPKSNIEFKMARCMYFPYDANYWHVKGLTFQNAKDNGVKVEGSYNIFEQCVFRGNNDTGLQIGMFKDWSIEETKSFPISGSPAYNPNYAYCRGNKVINCDSYNNYDAVTFTGTDDGGDADGFACKLFPGPGTEFHGCRAWNNSDDNWDLYMVYHPVVIDNCYAWNAALDADGNLTPGNGNGFKLGGGGSSGGAAFDQSTGAHVVRNCVSFSNTKKGFDQNNAYEGMYLFNNVAWDNDYNYRFPTVFKYGGMHIRNCAGFKPRTLNHEFLSENKEGSQGPDTEYNSWTTIDGCDPYKDGNKVNKTKIYVADHSAEFLSLLESDAKAARLPDGSLPENNFARLVSGSKFVDAGEIVENFLPVRFMTQAEAAAFNLELTTADVFSIEYNGASADMGAYESGTATVGKLYVTAGEVEQIVYRGDEISPVTVKWGGAATDVTVTGADALTVEKDMESKSVTVSGRLTASATVNISTVGGESGASVTIQLTASDTAPATLVCVTGNSVQTAFYGEPIADVVFEYGGGATGIEIEGLTAGLSYKVEGNRLTVSGETSEPCSYTVTATGGLKPVKVTGHISLEVANRVLTGDWYHIQDEYTALPEDLQGVVSIEQTGSYETIWDPTYTEKGTVPGGCTEGAVNVERGGALVWELPSLLELKANVHFTGGRYLVVKYQVEGEPETTWVSDKMNKTTLTAWDLMQAAGIEPTLKPITVKFFNDGGRNNGGIRVYDFYVKVAKEGAQMGGVEEITAPAMPSWYSTGSAIVVDGDNVAGVALYDLAGRMVNSTVASGILPLNGAPAGVYILQVVTADGKSVAAKIAI
ncbi:MAG: right-handed parallel beta-helix repeat-containing protein [Duncaniella sp.]|nr:right-handed parallel beta-helix repeat-containing protein [Duncaniella sp.]